MRCNLRVFSKKGVLTKIANYWVDLKIPGEMTLVEKVALEEVLQVAQVDIHAWELALPVLLAEVRISCCQAPPLAANQLMGGETYQETGSPAANPSPCCQSAGWCGDLPGVRGRPKWCHQVMWQCQLLACTGSDIIHRQHPGDALIFEQELYGRSHFTTDFFPQIPECTKTLQFDDIIIIINQLKQLKWASIPDDFCHYDKENATEQRKISLEKPLNECGSQWCEVYALSQGYGPTVSLTWC